MNTLLHILILLPVFGFIISFVFPFKSERVLSRFVFIILLIHLLLTSLFVFLWIKQGATTIQIKDWVLFNDTNYQFFIAMYFDNVTAVYLLVGSFLTFLVSAYSKDYMHKEKGFKRFFTSILFFYIGYNLTILAGNIETMFVGWEILGLSSFILIAFYHNRVLPVKNAIKVFSIYRISDVGIILAMWMSHHLWHENITFLKLNNYELVHEHLIGHSVLGTFISLMILTSAMAKSAQLPFSSWLPRAMEGPTPSSAIFYGSLSVHLGVFLLLRTYPFWEHQIYVRVLIAFIGLATSFICTGIARTQSSIKSQIAYASSAQIGLIFIEVAAGLEALALIHFAGNAFMRTYQLLTSPSVVSYLIQDQFYHFEKNKTRNQLLLIFPKKVVFSIYMLSIKEWNLESLMYKIYWNPLRYMGNKLRFLNVGKALLIFIPLYLFGVYIRYIADVDIKYYHDIPAFIAFIGLLCTMRAYAERVNVLLGWILILLNHFWIALAITFNEEFSLSHIVLYLSGVIFFGIIGIVLIEYLDRKEIDIDLDGFQGYIEKHPRLSILFLISSLAIVGFPITPTFIGEDVIFSHIHETQYLLAFFVTLSFIVNGLSVIRMYARVFLGPSIKNDQPKSYPSA
jgi:NADH:ubiquinone oxidoreductase subunit 5 (subunit L)/multisubunit Na+/H+ antiporter MnhA subunit